MLKRIGCEVLTARSGVDALEALRKCQNDVHGVLLDLPMPQMDGWETLRALRTIRSDLPAILASGYDEAKAMGGKHSELIQAFLHKPYTKQALEEAIGKALETF